MSDWPDWFPEALAAAQHQDKIASWPWYGQLLHRWFVSYRCPGCKRWKMMT